MWIPGSGGWKDAFQVALARLWRGVDLQGWRCVHSFHRGCADGGKSGRDGSVASESGEVEGDSFLL